MSSRQSLRTITGIALAALAFTVPAQTASAQGLFEALFGGFQRRAPAPQMRSYADPYTSYSHTPRRQYSGERSRSAYSGGGGGGSYCVRTCDGRFFPLQRNSGTSPAEMCKSFCPTAQTKVFSGSKIDHAVASDGTRYADLDNAFVYRERLVDNCTCNGKDSLGLARLDADDDPTVRPGDVVATNDGLTVARGSRGKTAEFTPIDESSRAWSKRFDGIKILPAPPVEKIQPVADASEKSRRTRNRSVQLSR